MTAGDPRVRRGMEAQLDRWRSLLAGGQARLGWKVGLTVPAVQERLGLSGPVVGFLTDGTLLPPGAGHSLAGGTNVAVEPEIAIEIAGDLPADVDESDAAGVIGALGPALELIDVDRDFDDLEAIVGTNIFHRGVMFGEPAAGLSPGSLDGVAVEVERNSSKVASADAGAAAVGLPALARHVAGFLGDCGESLRAGDRIICGSLTQAVSVAAGDVVAVKLGPLGALEIAFTD